MQSEFVEYKPSGRRGREPTNKLPPSRRRSHVLSVRLTQAEYQRIRADAADHQLSASALLASIVLGKDLQVCERTSSINELRRLGSQLKAALTHPPADDACRERLCEVLKAVQEAIRVQSEGGTQS